jgi:DNA-binding NtrC family response regulator
MSLRHRENIATTLGPTYQGHYLNEIHMVNSSNVLAPRAILLGLEPDVETELAASLRSASFAVSHGAGSPVARGGGLIFCSRGAAFAEAKAAFPDLPVIVVSRLPDTREWLEALELGARDYIAAPFETIQMRWLWEPQSHAVRASAAAA